MGAMGFVGNVYREKKGVGAIYTKEELEGVELSVEK